MEIDLLGQTESVYVADGTKFETNSEVCRKCGAYGTVYDTWRSQNELMEELRKTERE